MNTSGYIQVIEPCPTCGHCPTCGQFKPQPYFPPQPGPWYTTTPVVTSNNTLPPGTIFAISPGENGK